MKRLFFSLLFVIPIFSTFAQISNDKDIVDYLIKEGEINSGDNISVFAFELLKKSAIDNDDKCGIYRIGAFADHSFVYLLLMNNSRKQFVECHTNLSETLKVVFSFFDNSDCEFTDVEKLHYIRKIVDIYNGNLKAIPW